MPFDRPERNSAAPLPAARRGALQQCLGAAAILGCALLGAAHWLRLWASIQPGNALTLGAGIALGLLSADLATGIVHWACDRWGDEKTPGWGPLLIRSFREHHRDPAAMLRHDWIEINREAAGAAGIGFALLALPPLRERFPAGGFGHVFFGALLALAAVSNQLHAWAHAPRVPRGVRVLQRAGLILSRRGHAPHHRIPHTTRYCIATGWSNRWLDALGFWSGLERLVRGALNAPSRDPDSSRTRENA